MPTTSIDNYRNGEKNKKRDKEQRTLKISRARTRKIESSKKGGRLIYKQIKRQRK
jgi:hypothetical protein